MIVRELELDLDAFEGPFDLLLTLVLKEELEPAEVDVAAIVLAFVERLAEHATRPVSPDLPGRFADPGSATATPRSTGNIRLDLEACGEFLVLVSALLELKARGLFPEEEAELAELDPDEAAAELARRLEEYRRTKAAAVWLAERLEAERDRYFRLGPAASYGAWDHVRRLAPQDSEQLAAALRALAAEPPVPSVAHMGLRFPPVSQFLARFRAVLARRTRFDLDAEVRGLPRVDQAVAFLALLELRKSGEVALEQASPFAPIRVRKETTLATERSPAWTARSA